MLRRAHSRRTCAIDKTPSAGKFFVAIQERACHNKDRYGIDDWQLACPNTKLRVRLGGAA
jgi:hypothetical protein